ncbi:MAG: PqqD family protein [Thermoplasmatales archaeon]|nr:PqqD family protein [Thermoplasmatales archaeon]
MKDDSRPIRNVEWFEEEGLVRLKIIKFKSKIGKIFCKILKRPDYFIVNLDEIGSFAWRKFDGKNSVGEIMKMIEENYGKEKASGFPIFIKMLERNEYIRLE